MAKKRSKAPANRDAIDVAAALLPRHAFAHRTHKFAKTVSVTLIALLAFAGTGAAASYYRIMGEIDVTSNARLDDLLGGNRPQPPKDPNAGHALNMLVLGSDHRSEDLAALGDKTQGMRSDTAMIMHISADRKHVEVVSIPRDTMVSIPSCVVGENADGTHKMSKAQRSAMFNSAFQTGAAQSNDPALGAICAMKTIEENTQITLDDFVVVDFDGFAAMIDSVDGVELCVPAEIDDAMTGTTLDVGWHTLRGDDALGYVRARHGVSGSDGSDINRMSRQQKFVSALMRKVLTAEVLANPTKLVPFLVSVTQSLTASEDIATATTLAGLALSLKDIDTSNVRFLTAPFQAYPADKNRLQFSKKADELWQLIIEDKPLTGFDPDAQATADGTSAPPATQTPGAEATTKAPATGKQTTSPSGTATTTDSFDSTSGAEDPDDAICGQRPS